MYRAKVSQKLEKLGFNIWSDTVSPSKSLLSKECQKHSSELTKEAYARVIDCESQSIRSTHPPFGLWYGLQWTLDKMVNALLLPGVPSSLVSPPPPQCAQLLHSVWFPLYAESGFID